MKKTLMAFAALVLASVSMHAASAEPDWQNPAVNERNRVQMTATFETTGELLTLNGDWKFQWFATPAERSADFYGKQVDDSAWGTMPVPGLWELNGYGDPLYLNIGYAWRGHYKNNPPIVPEEQNHVGQYRRHFTLDRSWVGSDIFLTIGSATSNVRVWVNGKEVGYSEDSKLAATFDVTKYVVPGDNLIALEVFRWCDGTYLEDQDFWRFSGLARDTYLTARPKSRLQDIHINASMSGDFTIEAWTTKGVTALEFIVFDNAIETSDKVVLSKAETKEGKVVFDGHIDNPSLWSAETPHLYTLLVNVYDKKGCTESAGLDFGFRDVVIKDGQLLVNGKPVLFKGADRHELSAAGGYVVSEDEMIRDIAIMKRLNINGVRTCHYPDDPRWYALCDRYGLYVVAECNIESHGMGYGDATLAKDPQYELSHLQRVQRELMRDINHPSVIVWSLGNEAGNGPNFEKAYDWAKAYDTTRPVQYERAELSRNTDVFCPMYYTYDKCDKYASSDPERPLIQCEYAHAMGNSMGGFKEYWDLIRKYPKYQGGFIWDFQDQAILWPAERYRKADLSKSGTDHIYAFGGDFNDYDPTDNSFNCNGIIASDRSLHPHAYEVAYQQRSIITTATPEEALRGEVNVYNENFFINLDRYILDWNLTVDGDCILAGTVGNISCEPQQTVKVSLGYTAAEVDDILGRMAVSDGADLHLNIQYILKRQDGLLPAGSEVAYDQIFIESIMRPYVAESAPGTVAVAEAGGKVIVSGMAEGYGVGLAGRMSPWSVTFDKASGAMVSYTLAGKEMVSEPLMPCFGRAVTENDLGAKLQKKMKEWLYPDFKVSSFKCTKSSEAATIAVEYKLPKAVVAMKYEVKSDGSVAVTESMKDSGGLSQCADLFRFGVEMAMPGQYSTLDFLGRGPFENYADRNSAASFGRYTQRVEEQYHWGYVRPQESGTHTDMKWMRLLDDDGDGLQIASQVRFSASALPLSRRDLDLSIGRHQHSLELRGLACEGHRKDGKTYLNVDLRQMGLGCVTSWGAIPREEYMIKAGEYEFAFTITPVLH